MSYRSESRDDFTGAWLVITVLVLQVFFFAPIQVLSQNFGEFSVRFVDVLLSLLVISLALIAVLYLLIRLLRVPALLAVLTFLSTIAFLESRFFLNFAGHPPFGGKPIDWNPLMWLSYLELGVIFALGSLFWGFRRQTKFLSVVSLFILLFLTAGFVIKTSGNLETLFPGRQAADDDTLYFEQFHRLSSNRNVIHIVPDQAQGAMFYDILNSDYENYSRIFDGFTLFTQATGRYKSTYPSVLYYMSGESPNTEFDLVMNQPFTWDYIEKTLKERSIVTLLSENDFNTFGFQFYPGVFCKGSYTACTGTHDEVFAGLEVIAPGKRLAITILSALDLGLFQVSPIVLRKQVYGDGNWFLRNMLKRDVTHSGILDLFVEEMQVDEIPGSYNYFHHAGAHAPVIFDRNCKYIGPQPVNWPYQGEQLKCSLMQFEKLITNLKQKGIYDQTMIVIHGDHGTPDLPPSTAVRSANLKTSQLMGVASVALLIKPLDARGPLGFSSQAVDIGDIPATIAAAFGFENSYQGLRMFREEASADRERQFFTYDSSSKTHSLQSLPNLMRYRIGGNVFDQRDWVFPSTVSNGMSVSQLRMDDPDFLNYAQGFSFLEHHDAPKRWVDGTNAKVLLSPPPRAPMALVFESYVPESIDGQWMEISVEGKVIARLDETALREGHHVIPLADRLTRAKVLTIEFTMGKTLDSAKETRDLSVLFTYIGLKMEFSRKGK